MSRAADPLDALSAEERAAAPAREQPEWTDPMLATLTDERFDDPGWIYERKLDGVRLLTFVEDGHVRLTTRNRKRRNATYPDVVEAFEAMEPPDGIYDGEVVAFEGNVSSFQRLQERSGVEEEAEARERAKKVAVYLYLFDVLHLAGHDLTALPLDARKRVLEAALDYEGGRIRYLEHRRENGVTYWKQACEKGWEGVIAKDASSPYVHARSKSWLKFKCVNEQELVVGGFTEPGGERVGFGAMLLGYYDGGDLVYAGKVGTGWNDATLRELRNRMDALERKTSPFDRGDPDTDGVHWITPDLVAEIGFTEWTDDGRLRHPRYLGMRADKDARDVVRERPQSSS